MLVNPPRQLVVETSAVCGLRCPQCWVGLRRFDRKHFMSLELFNKIADEAQDYIKHTYLHLWGEPTLNKNLPAMIRRTKEFSTVDLATHGLNMTEEMADAIAQCDTISVSIDGITQEVYGQYRAGGQLEDALSGLRLLIAKAPGRVNWTYVVFRQNEHQAETAQKLADEIGAHIGFKPPIFWDRSKMTDSMPSDEKHRRYRWDGNEWVLKADRRKCREFWETVYVLPSGDVVTCCYDGAAQWVMGNVNERSLLDVWNGEEYTKMRTNHMAGNLNPLCERLCQLPC